MRILAALGGNALLKRGEPLTEVNQRANVKRAANALAELVEAGHQLVVTHGNGPQVGLLALQSAAGPSDGALPLDVLDAESQGMIGYLLEQELSTLLPERQFATLLTQVRVNADDSAFANPTKPIGPVYSEKDARDLASTRGWSIAPDGAGWRRVVASPAPLEILERDVIALLADRGVTVICGGGGGIPVVRRSDGSLAGIEGVIDKDAASALLGLQLRAEMMLLLTDVEGVFANFGTPDQHVIGRAHVKDINPDSFPAGSMRPKINAAIRFVAETGKPVVIGSLQNVSDILKGTSGTWITQAGG